MKKEKPDHGEQTPDAYQQPSECGSFSLCSSSDTRLFQLSQHCRVPKLLGIQIHHRDTNAMFYFTLAEFMQVRLPVRVFLQIFSDVFREQNVSGIAAVHHPLRHIDASSSHVRFSGCVDDPTDRSTVYAHSQLNLRILLESTTDFQRAFNRRFWAMIKN